MTHFLYGAGQVGLGAASAWLGVTALYESTEWMGAKWDKLRKWWRGRRAR